jgi:co-chaperonin GroES (HSP10)
MTQTRHTFPEHIPLPLSTIGALIEVDYTEIQTTLELAGGKLFNTPTAVVRAFSPEIPRQIREALLPGGDGSVGVRVLFSRDNARYLLNPEYDACGIPRPEPEENGLGDLAFLNYDRIIATIKDDDSDETDMDSLTTLPLQPLGARVFFEFDLDDESIADVTLDSGLIVREKDLASDNQLATVTAVGPLCEHVSVGDRVIVKRMHSGIIYEGTEYFFTSSEHEVFAVLRRAPQGE